MSCILFQCTCFWFYDGSLCHPRMFKQSPYWKHPISLKLHATIPQFIISWALTKILLPNNGSLMSRDYLVFKTHKCDLYEVFDGNPLDMPSSRCYIRNWYHWRLNGFASTMSLIGYRWEFDVCDESDFMRNTCNNRVLQYQ